ncbi:MAG: pyridoxal phosphate-dependent aminotransferase [Desulfosarcinaceae bacterium]|nr:pyridoxal phosphate-dependent aminotransferase [Desulfosarcinaceae bacterium]
MHSTPMAPAVVRHCIETSGLSPVGMANIRELNRLVGRIEAQTGETFIRMEMGIPGLDPPAIAVEAEKQALTDGVGAVYPPFDGVPALKKEIARFLRNFLNVAVDAQHCLPTVGAMQGCFLAMMMAGRRIKGREKMVFIDPGFPVNKLQAQVLGLPQERFDVYDHRGEALRSRLSAVLERGDVAAILYSNPNNPAWICFDETELGIIGELATRHDVVVIEDLAYIGMDFRQDYGRPGEAPWIPTVARYTNNYVLIISASKSFSLAGQRIGMTAIADSLFRSRGNNLKRWFGSDQFGYAYIFGAVYAMCAGVSHSAQYGLTALLRAVNSGVYDFVDAVRVYGDRARTMKALFLQNGFTLVYDQDLGQPLADGFYFTVAYPGFSGVQLVEELLYYGISAISLTTTGSDRHEGIRACVSLTDASRFDTLEARLVQFHRDHSAGRRIVAPSSPT